MTTPGSGRQVKIIISADVAQAIRSLGQVEQGLGGVAGGAEQAQKKTSTMGDVMKGTLAASGIEAGLGGIVSGFKSVVSGGLEYESSMNTFRAVTQSNDAQMQQMAETAKSLGADIKIPGASAQSAAAAMTELAKGGLSAQEAMEASRGTMILAAAAQIDGAQAAEIQANALNTFGLKADEAGRVANVLANVANQSSGEISDFAQGLAQAGTVASGFGWTIEETTAFLGLMANAGIKGSDAGTSLKTAMTALLNPSKNAAAALEELGIQTRDANGNMISAKDLTAQLAAAKTRMSAADFNAAAATAFGTDAVRTALVAAQAGTEGYDQMTTSLGNVTGAQDVAAANSKGLTGVIDALKNTVDTASLSLFETLQPSIMKVAEAATGLVGPLAEGLAPALGSVADLATGTLAPAIGTLTGVITAIAGPVAGLAGWIGDLPGPIGAAVLALGGVILLRGPLTATFTSFTASAGALLATLRGTAGAAVAGSAGLAGWIASLRAASGAAATFGVVARGALAILGGPIGLAIVGAATALSFFSSSTDEATGSTEDFTLALDEQTGALNENAAKVLSAKVESSGLGDAYRAIGGNTADLVDALGGFADKQDVVNGKIAEAQAAAKAAGVQVNSLGQVVGGTASSLDGMSTSFNNTNASVQQNSVAFLNAQKSGELFAQLSGELAGKQEDVKNEAAGASGELAKAAGVMDDVAGAAGNAEQAATPFGDALKEIRSAASEADAATQFLSITLLEMSGITVTADQRARANAAAFRDVAQAARDSADADDKVAEAKAKAAELSDHLGTTLNGEAVSATNLAVTQRDVDAALRGVKDAEEAAADASDKQKDALDKAAESARTMTGEAYANNVGQLGMKGAIDKAILTMQEQRRQFVASAIDAGYSAEEAENLANKQNLIPDNVRTTYESVGAEDATTQAKNLNAALDKINDRTVRYTVEGGEVTAYGALPVTAGSFAVRAQGGIVHGPGTGTSDSIPVRLSDGEFVVRASQTAKHRELLEAVNTPGFAEGGLVSAKVQGDYKTPDFTAQLQSGLDGWIKKVKESLVIGGAGVRNAFLQAILSKQGTSYVWGAAGPDVFDCSGLMSWGLNQAGVGKGRLTAEGFNSGFPSTTNPLPGDMVTFDTGRLPGRAGHIGAVLDPAARTMMHTDGAGPARVQGYAGRSGFLRFVNVIGNSAPAGGMGGPNGAAGDLPTSANGSGVAGWRDTVLRALARTGQSASLADVVLNQMRTESSGNPQAMNNWDSNARRGTPSKGLMQVIDPTFQTYRDRGLLNDIWNPMANIVAAINYTLARYGSVSAGMRGVAYDNGGVLPPGFTMAYNGTGKNEQVFTREQMVDPRTFGGGNNSHGGQQQQSGGWSIGTLNAFEPGRALAEVELALTRAGI